MKCNICTSGNIHKIYNGKIRSGSYGQLTNKDYQVFECNECDTIFLDKFTDDDYYESEEYRKDYNDEACINRFQNLQDELENEKIFKIGLHNFRNKIVADFGTGGGSFLDGIVGFASKTIAIEPSQFFHKYLSQKHQVFSYGSELAKSNEKIDIATSFDVIEHVPNPISYLEDIFESLKIDGELHIMTPNFDEILNDLIKDDFDTFNYRTAHLYYFKNNSMKYMLDKVGFKNITIEYHHKRDLSNLLFWLNDKKPTGDGKYNLFDEEFNILYKRYLEKKAKASHILIKAVKK